MKRKGRTKKQSVHTANDVNAVPSVDSKLNSGDRLEPSRPRWLLFLGVLIGIAAIVVRISSITRLHGDSPEEFRESLKKTPRKDRTAKPWKKIDVKFNHSQLLEITTLNFNSTLESVFKSNLPMMILFYDPRSVSFLVHKSKLEKVADILSDSAQGPIARFGIVDVTLHSFLGLVEAPHLLINWQGLDDKGKFKFGQARQHPCIFLLYEAGSTPHEYTGVVELQDMYKHVARLSSVPPDPGFVTFNTSKDVSVFFARMSGPFVVACGIKEGTNESKTFNSCTANFRGWMTFVNTSSEICSDVLKPLVAPWPKLIWFRSWNNSTEVAQGIRRIEDPTTLQRTSFVNYWLGEHKDEVLASMTPDNSHVFLNDVKPLVIYLSSAKIANTVEIGTKLFNDISTELNAALDILTNSSLIDFATREDYNFVQSECWSFVAQFEASIKECPMLIAVDTYSIKWKKISMAKLENPVPNNRRDKPKTWEQVDLPLPSRMLAWIREVTKPWQRKDNNTSRKETSNERTSSNDVSDNHDADDSDDDDEFGRVDDVALGPSPANGPDWYLKALPHLDKMDNGNLAYIFGAYHELLDHIDILKRSFETVYGDSVPFDWTSFDEVQALDPNMRLLGNPERLQRQFHSGKLSQMWFAIEKRASLMSELAEDGPKVLAKHRGLTTNIRKGLQKLRSLWVQLYKKLHRIAKKGSIKRLGKTMAIDRRDVSELSVKEFVDQYARVGKPVIITGIQLNNGENWTLDFFKRKCNVTANLNEKNDSRKSWGRLQGAGKLNLPDFIDTFTTNETRRSWYLHDWSLPRYCPSVFGHAPFDNFRVPKYFVGDYFQRVEINGFQHTWPSLFIGSEKTESAMHIDSGGTNFWLQLLSGRKEWRFYSLTEMINLYAEPLSQHFFPDAFRPAEKDFPLLKYSHMYEGVQEAGELIFIPAGHPHAVRNLEPIHALSMNYVDVSNIWMYLKTQLVDMSWNNIEAFTDNTTMTHGIQSEAESMLFGEWKSTRWNDLEYDII